MSLDSIHKVPGLSHLVLLPVMALALYIAFIPHINYHYPVHIDEWVHLAHSEAMLSAGSTAYIDPFLGQWVIGLLNPLHEVGFHILWGVFQRISGLSWMDIFRYFPSIILMLTALSVYIVGRREGFGWEAAFFACLIPTTVGIMGPAFLVPVAMGLLFVPLVIFLAFNLKSAWSYLAVFILTCSLLSIHIPSATWLVIILTPYILLNLKGNWRHSLALALALIIPFLAPFSWITDMLLPYAKELLLPQPLETYIDYPLLIRTYGYLLVGYCLLGTLVLALKGDRKYYGLVLGLLVILLLLAIRYTFLYGVHMIYGRGLMFMMLMAGIVAGAGLGWVKEIRLPEGLSKRLRIPRLVNENTGRVLCLALVVITLVIYIPARQGIPYYHMIDDYDYEAFTWIGENVSDDYGKAVLDPWKATAFAAITEKKVFTKIHAYPKPSDNEAYAFLNNGCVDTAFLKDNGITIVYTRGSCDNPALTLVREGVYLIEQAN